MSYSRLTDLDRIERRINKNKKVIVNLSHTKYPIIKDVCETVFDY